jgi:hypothetical protein
MFLDSLVGDAAWRAKYAKNRAGEPMPFGLHEEEMRATHPYDVFSPVQGLGLGLGLGLRLGLGLGLGLG